MAITPLFSVVVPTCSRLEDLARCLEPLATDKQEGVRLLSAAGPESTTDHGPLSTDLPSETFESRSPRTPSYEVIVTDDGSEASAKAMIAERFPWATWTPGPRRGPAANRNHGAQIASAEWVVFIDDDCFADPHWLKAIARHADTPELDVIEGRTVIPGKRDNPFLHGVENEMGECYWSCNLAVRRNRFLEIGGFDEEFLRAGGEDMEFAWRFQRRGLRPVFEPGALVLHPQRPYGLAGFLKRVPLLKWSLLYYQKTGQAPPPGSPAGRIALAVLSRHCLSLLRQTWRNFTGKNPGGRITRWFNSFWAWLILPFQLPYLIWWEFKFRKHEARRPGRPPLVHE